MQQNGEARAVQRGEPGDHPLVIELGFHLLEGAGAIRALVLARLHLCLQLLDPCFERAVLLFELVDALPQGFVARQVVGGGQRLASKLRGREPGDEKRRKRNACQDGHPRRHGAV